MQFYLDGFRPGDPDVRQAAQGIPGRAEGLPAFVDVLIAGCGPAGLCLAAQLSGEASIRTMIVEPKLGPMEKGQADGINLRSMEMFQAFGFAAKIQRESVGINETTFWKPDPASPAQIRRIGRVQDVADGLSEMPHVLINQARIHDMFLDIMRNSPTRLQPDYGLKVADLAVDQDLADYPVMVTLEHTAPDRVGERMTVRARYVVGCDGARSTVRQAIGGSLHGDSANQAWGVIDMLATTDFPDFRMKSIIQSTEHGSILLLPREGGYLVRLYVELDRLGEGERITDRGMDMDDIIAKAQRILAPYTMDVKEVVWWSIYEVGHRLTDRFDDVPPDQADLRAPRVLLAGDACHTHSPKAGQGMNVSMGDAFNLGWKLRSVLTGITAPGLLHTYTAERQAAAKALVEFDHRWSRTVGSLGDEDVETVMPRVQREFIASGEFTAGLTVCYSRSALIAADAHQALAKGFPIGKRFHSGPVVRLADALPMQLGHVVEADGRWRLILFASRADTGHAGGVIDRLCHFLESDPASPVVRFGRPSEDVDALIDVRAVFHQHFRALSVPEMPSLLRPHKGRYGLCDYEKIFCAGQSAGTDIFNLRGIAPFEGCAVIVRPDQYVAAVFPLTNHAGIADFFSGFLMPQLRDSGL